MRYYLLLLLLSVSSACFGLEYHNWIKPVYYSDEQYADDNIYGYRTNAGGVLFGADIKRQNCLLGIGLSYFNTKQKDINNTSSQVNINNYAIAIYGEYDFPKKYFIDWQFNAGLNNYKSTRAVISNINATGAYLGQQYIAQAAVNKQYCQNRWVITPQFNANIMYQEQNSYSEAGAGIYDQNYATRTALIFMLGGGFKITSKYERSKVEFIPELTCFVFYDVLRADLNALTAFLIGGPAITTSAAAEPASGQLGVSLSTAINKLWQIKASYDLLVKSYYFNNVLALRLVYSFK